MPEGRFLLRRERRLRKVKSQAPRTLQGQAQKRVLPARLSGAQDARQGTPHRGAALLPECLLLSRSPRALQPRTGEAADGSPVIPLKVSLKGETFRRTDLGEKRPGRTSPRNRAAFVLPSGTKNKIFVKCRTWREGPGGAGRRLAQDWDVGGHGKARFTRAPCSPPPALRAAVGTRARGSLPTWPGRAQGGVGTPREPRPGPVCGCG